uniref:FtsX-like permease family protein n=1 Tax=Ndongobacter massiliensis TaxID=1871025 RepID=UPI0009307577|nr:ABC transporter permease [Ndongobacter massiliensis]
MFSKLVARNSKRNRKDNLLYFSSMIISIVAFYIVLSLSNQDVMTFLKKMESDAVARLMSIIPVFYLTSLFILFFLVYFAGSIQIERRKHEFGVYLTLGMKRSRLFVMLLLEELRNSFIALAIGLPVAVLLSELISLVTAKVVGLGIIGHQFSFSFIAVIFTVIGFLLVKVLSCIFLSFKVTGKEIGELLTDSPSGIKKQLPKIIYIASMILGILMLIKAYKLGISGDAWLNIKMMGVTLLLGGLGTILLFFGLRTVIGFLAGTGNRNKKKLHAFNFRQIQELVIRRSTTVAICSLLIFSALCLFGAGIAFSTDRSENAHILDYTFSSEDWEKELDAKQVESLLQNGGIASKFSSLLEIRVGAPIETNALSLDNLIEQIEKADSTEAQDTLLHNLASRKDSYFISLSGYNELRKVANLEPLALQDDEAVLYMGKDFLLEEALLNSIIKTEPSIQQSGNSLTLVGQVESLPIVTDRAITLAFALIVPDQVFDSYTGGDYSNYVSAVLDPDFVQEKGLMQAIMEINSSLDPMPIHYESYLQNMGRQLFYTVAASYLTIYLAIIFLVVANTAIGVQFLMGQRKTHKRYHTLVHLGATYQTLCKSARKQVNWYFGLPIAIALINSIFGVMTLFAALLPSSGLKANLGLQLLIAGVAIFVLAIIEYIYMTLVKKSSDRFLWTLMKPKRIE